MPYLTIFLLFTLYPVLYGLWLGSDPASYATLWDSPTYARTFWNTVAFLAIAVNLKILLALLLSGFFVAPQRWVRWLSVILFLPWAIPSVPAILSFRWMFDSDWGLINSTLLSIGIEGPQWLSQSYWPMLVICIAHIWKFLPFWVIVFVAGRLAIRRDLYDAAAADGASTFQCYRYVTWPGLRNLYITNTLVAMTWALGDFNTIYLMTGGGPMDRTHTLTTLGFRYAFVLSDFKTGIATVITILPLLIPLVWVLARRMTRATPS